MAKCEIHSHLQLDLLAIARCVAIVSCVAQCTHYACCWQGERRIFSNFHRQVFCWTDEWHGLTMTDIRALEDKTKVELDEVCTTCCHRSSCLMSLAALERQVMQSPWSVWPSVFLFFLCFHLADLWPWPSACVWVITIVCVGLKVKFKGHNAASCTPSEGISSLLAKLLP